MAQPHVLAEIRVSCSTENRLECSQCQAHNSFVWTPGKTRKGKKKRLRNEVSEGTPHTEFDSIKHTANKCTMYGRLVRVNFLIDGELL